MKKYMFAGILMTLLLITWEIVARIVKLGFILPAPSEVLVTLWQLKTELFIHHLPVTLSIIAIGLTISLLLGSMLAIWMHRSSVLEQTLYPILITSQTIPIIALAPIFVLWFGYTIWSKVEIGRASCR